MPNVFICGISRPGPNGLCSLCVCLAAALRAPGRPSGWPCKTQPQPRGALSAARTVRLAFDLSATMSPGVPTARPTPCFEAGERTYPVVT